MTAEEIFNEKSYFNKWLKELTDSEKHLIIEMLNEFASQKDASRVEEIHLAIDPTDNEVLAAYSNLEKCRLDSIETGAEIRTLKLHHDKPND